jgi:hypothetical protein
VPELGSHGSVRGARGNSRPYRESDRQRGKTTRMTQRGQLTVRASASSLPSLHHTGCCAPGNFLAQISLIVTPTLPRVALEYGQIFSASSTRSFATLRSKPGSLTLSRVLRKWPPSPRFRSTSASMLTLAGSAIFLLRATSAIAFAKEADQPAANSCSGLVTDARRTGGRKPDVEQAVRTARGAVIAIASGLGLGRM